MRTTHANSMFERVHSFSWYDTFICVFVTRHKFTIKHCVYFYIAILLHNTLHTFEHNFSRILEKLTRFDMLRVYYRTNQYAILESRIYRIFHLSPALYPVLACTKRPRIESFKLSSRAIWITNDCLIPINNRGCFGYVHPIRLIRHIAAPTRYTILAYSIGRLAPANHVPFAPYQYAAQNFHLGYWWMYFNLFILKRIASLRAIMQMPYQITSRDVLRHVLDKNQWPVIGHWSLSRHILVKYIYIYIYIWHSFEDLIETLKKIIFNTNAKLQSLQFFLKDTDGVIAAVHWFRW